MQDAVTVETIDESKLALVWHAARRDWVSVSWRGRGLLVVAVATVGYEWSSLNESVVSLFAARRLAGRMSAGGVVMAGASVGALVVVTQLVAGSILAAAVRRVVGLFEVLATVVESKFGRTVPAYMDVRWPARVPISFFMGSSFVVTQDAVAKQPHVFRSVVWSAFTAGAAAFVVVGVFGGAVVACDGTPLAGAARFVFGVIKDWRTWVAILLGPSIVSWVLRRRRRPRHAAG